MSSSQYLAFIALKFALPSSDILCGYKIMDSARSEQRKMSSHPFLNSPSPSLPSRRFPHPTQSPEMVTSSNLLNGKCQLAELKGYHSRNDRVHFSSDSGALLEELFVIPRPPSLSEFLLLSKGLRPSSSTLTRRERILKIEVAPQATWRFK